MAEEKQTPEYPDDIKLPRVCPQCPDVVANTKEEVTKLFGWRMISKEPVKYAPQSWSKQAKREAAAKKKEERQAAEAKAKDNQGDHEEPSSGSAEGSA